MKRDCPHCHKSMGGRFMRTTQLTNIDKSRNCPLCNGNIELRMHPEEIAARLATIVAAIVAGYFAKEHRASYLAILLSLTAFLVAVYVGVSLLLRDRQRFGPAKL
jgi:hypothetical protein